MLALQRSAGNRAVSALLAESGPQLQRLTIGGERITADRHVKAAIDSCFLEIASETPTSRPFLDRKAATRKTLETWVRKGVPLGRAAVDPKTFADWPTAVRAAYQAVGGHVKASEAAPPSAEQPAPRKKKTRPPEPVVNSHRGQALEKDVFRADVLAYLRMWPEVEDAESAADAICRDASQIVASIAQLTTTLSANEKSSPHKSQHTKAVNHLKYLMVTGKINALGKDESISDLESQKQAFHVKAFEKGETHHKV